MIMTLAVLQTIQLMDKPVCPFCVDALKACWNLILNQENEKDRACISRTRLSVKKECFGNSELFDDVQAIGL
ncbi:hypothetical protein ACFLR7_04535 [Acidobacteriota bacterium]